MAEWANRIVGEGTEAPDQLLANPQNWRIHPKAQQQALGAVLDDVGWVQRVIVNRQTGHVVDGHLRIALAISRAEPTVPVVYVDLTDAEERLVLASLDPLAGMAVIDQEMFAALTAELTVTDEELARLLGQGRKPGKTDPDEVPPKPAKPRTKPGDLWLLGPHQLLCGDAADPGAWGQMAGDGALAALWTDPPYGVAVASRIGTTGVSNSQARSLGGKTIESDDVDQVGLEKLLREVFEQALGCLLPGGAIYVAAPSGPQAAVFHRVLLDLGIWRQTLIWVKDSLVLSRQDYHYRHEFVMYGWKPGGKHRFRGGRNQDTVWEIPRPKRSEEHPTMKPVELITRAIENSTEAGEAVGDPFLGSGSTLIAAEQTGRRCLAMDIDPVYCDVAVKRWENFTGEKASRG